MTVQELLDELRDRDPSMEVFATFTTDDEQEDALVTSAYVSLGRVFLGTGDDD